ncbi:MAG: trypsin-like peptidase domain-containing protein [Armatimonadota bacterium]
MKLRFFILALISIWLAAPLGATTMQDLSNDITALIRHAGSAVVEIHSVQKVYASSTDTSNAAKEPVGLKKRIGSGFVISADGSVMTTGSVVNGADAISVRFTDGTAIDGKLMGIDPLTDIAVVKVKGSGLKFLELGDSNALAPGMLVLSINNQSGMINSASLGMISGVSRRMGLSASGLLQISGTVGPGASGGPVLDCKGKVVGVTVAMMAPSATFLWSKLPDDIKTELVEHEWAMLDLMNRLGFKMRTSSDTVVDIENLLNDLTNVSGSSGFAIPIDKVKPVIEDMKAGRPVKRSRLGVSVADRDGELVLVPLKDGPAATAGIQPGDVFVNADGKTFRTAGEFSDYILNLAPGDVVTLAVKRGKETKLIKVKLGERALDTPQPTVSKNNRITISSSGSGTVGVTALTLETATGAVAVARSGNRIALDIKKSTFKDVALALTKATDRKITITNPNKLNRVLTLKIEQTTFEQALEATCKAAGCTYRVAKGAYVIISK